MRNQAHHKGISDGYHALQQTAVPSVHSALSHHLQINMAINDGWPKQPPFTRSFLVHMVQKDLESCVTLDIFRKQPNH